MKLSIITVNLNNAVGLHKTIDSILCQTSDEFEFIIIDGGSTDGSKELIEQLAVNDHRLTYWISESDNGIYHAMNKGIKQSKGDFLHFLNSGDCLVDQKVVEDMLTNLHDCDIFIGRKINVRSDGKLQKEIQNKKVTLFTFYWSSLQHTSAYIKSSLFKDYGYYDETLKIVSDWKWYLIVAGLNGAVVRFTDRFVSFFDTTGISSVCRELEMKERKQVLKELLPNTILEDYNNYSFDIIQMERIKKYKFFYVIFSFVERVLFKIEKFELKFTWK